MIDLDYPAVLDLFSNHLDPKRTESASFLIWYLENYYRLDTVAAVDSVCDQRGDKGVDGIYLSDGDKTIDVFQCRLSQKKDSSIGDAALREFCGTLSQFETEASIRNLIASGGEAEVARLARRLDLVNKVGTHDVRGVFISNLNIDENGISYLKTVPQIIFVGRSKLLESYIPDKRLVPVPSTATFDISGLDSLEYILDKKTKCLIAPIKATELARLQGISDQSLFAFNVRGPLGRTQVNKDIERSIKDPKTHRLFPLFHNGITIICGRVDSNSEKIEIENYFVVNGCQSLDSMYLNNTCLTDELRLLTRFVQVEVESSLSEMVTTYSNNQNAVNPRDSKANDSIQIRLQNEFKANYSSDYSFEIKRGEISMSGEIITNEDAGLYLWAFDLKEPWATHRRYQVFEEKYTDLFGRPQTTADRIVMCHIMMKCIAESTGKINNRLFGKYALLKYAMLYMLRNILESDHVGMELINNPAPFVRTGENRKHLQNCMTKIIGDMVVDINAEVDAYGDEFDYRGKLRDSAWVKELSREVVKTYVKMVQRKRVESFESEWIRQRDN